MGSELTTNGDALRLFFTDDIYLIKGEEGFSTEEVVLSDVQVVDSISEAVPLISVKEEIPKSAGSIPVVVPTIATANARVTIPVLIPTVEKPAALSFDFLGNNKKKILILVNDAEHEVSDEPGRELLRKIVKSINLTAKDFALLNYAKYPQTSFATLQQYFSSVLVFAFGVSPAALQLPAHPENKVVNEGSVRLIFSGELRKLDQDPIGKKELWGSLKQLV